MQVKSEKNKLIMLLLCIFAFALILGIGTCVAFAALPSRGYQNYVLQKKQYFVEASKQYAYQDALSVEYPRLERIKGPQVAQINKLIYDTAMDRINYWHLYPNEEVRTLQTEYHVFSSDVHSDVTYHSQYLLSIDFNETYAPISPVYYVNLTERALNVDLETGEAYQFNDVLQVDKAFVKKWCKAVNEEYGDSIALTDEVYGIILEWFQDLDDYINEDYDFAPFFYITQEKDFMVGLSFNPKAAALTSGKPTGSGYCVRMTAEELEGYRTDSVFWDKYEKSETAGEVRECTNLKENTWLGEKAKVWSYWDKQK